MSRFLRSHKIIKELRDDIRFEFPSVLQKSVIPQILESEQKSLTVQYEQPDGIKVAVFLPVIDHMIKQTIKNSVNNEQAKPLYVAVICQSELRCAEIAQWVRQLVSGC